MTSFSIQKDKRHETYVRLVGAVRNELLVALSEEHRKRGVTAGAIAALLGKHKSFVSRVLNRTGNITLSTLADLAYALDRPVRISLPSRDTLAHEGSNAIAGWSTTPIISGAASAPVHSLSPTSSSQSAMLRASDAK